MANPRYNKQVAQPRGMKVGGRVKKNGWRNVYKKKRYEVRLLSR